MNCGVGDADGGDGGDDLLLFVEKDKDDDDNFDDALWVNLPPRRAKPKEPLAPIIFRYNIGECIQDMFGRTADLTN